MALYSHFNQQQRTHFRQTRTLVGIHALTEEKEVPYRKTKNYKYTNTITFEYNNDLNGHLNHPRIPIILNLTV